MCQMPKKGLHVETLCLLQLRTTYCSGCGCARFHFPLPGLSTPNWQHLRSASQVSARSDLGTRRFVRVCPCGRRRPWRQVPLLPDLRIDRLLRAAGTGGVTSLSSSGHSLIPAFPLRRSLSMKSACTPGLDCPKASSTWRRQRRLEVAQAAVAAGWRSNPQRCVVRRPSRSRKRLREIWFFRPFRYGHSLRSAMPARLSVKRSLCSRFGSRLDGQAGEFAARNPT